MVEISPGSMAEWDQWMKFIDDELDHSYTVVSDPDYTMEQADTEGMAPSLRIAAAVPVHLGRSLIPIVMFRANQYRLQRDRVLALLQQEIERADRLGLDYVHTLRLQRIIDEVRDEDDDATD